MKFAEVSEAIDEELKWFKSQQNYNPNASYDAGFVRGAEHVREKIYALSLTGPERRSSGGDS